MNNIGKNKINTDAKYDIPKVGPPPETCCNETAEESVREWALRQAQKQEYEGLCFQNKAQNKAQIIRILIGMIPTDLNLDQKQAIRNVVSCIIDFNF
jgi:hypothetical protein